MPRQPLLNAPVCGEVADDATGGSVVAGIISFIKNGLRSGAFAPGQRLIEADICQQTNAGRSSVREAMRRLTAEGLVDLEHHKGARVRKLDTDQVLDLYQVREVLEGLAARLAARNIGARDNRKRIQRLEEEYDSARAHGPADYMAYNMAFHKLIVDLAGNQQLTQLYDQLELPAFLSLLHVIVDPPATELSRSEHRPIVAAILAADENAAADAMQKHIARTARHVREQADGPNFKRRPAPKRF